VFVKEGDLVQKNAPLLTLEGEKATMEVPSEHTGKIIAWHIALNQSLASGMVMGSILVEGAVEATTLKAAPVPEILAPEPEKQFKKSKPEGSRILSDPIALPYAGPATRRVANRFGVDLRWVAGTEEKGRVIPNDVLDYIKERVIQAQNGGSAVLPQSGSTMTLNDFEKHGPVTMQPLTKIKQFAAKHLSQAWVSIPHVTQMGQADVTAIEEARLSLKADGIKISVLMVVLKQLVESLKAFPAFNASLSSDGKSIILKQYYHIGVAVDTPQGLVVPVIRDIDQCGLMDLSKRIQMVAEKARTKGLTPQEMQGGCFTVSSLGGFGGTAFTPIVNAPEVAILGLSRAAIMPQYQDGLWVPRLMLPLSLSYDHRVIDGVEGARFLVDLSDRLASLTTEDVIAMCQS
jgi:pyruvate dehydrogenase E2 component (dihydrolipoamide acetyltransferase)